MYELSQLFVERYFFQLSVILFQATRGQCSTAFHSAEYEAEADEVLTGCTRMS